MAIDNILYVNTASIAVGTITDASGVGLVPSASHALAADSVVSASYALNAGNAETANTASYVAGSNVDGAVASATSASHALVADTALSYMEMPKYKAGVVAGGSFSGVPLTYTVEFTTPFDDDNYAPSVIGGNNRGFTCESVVSGSFIISSNSAQPLDEPVYWVAIATGESN
jgi:hypothetical protein